MARPRILPSFIDLFLPRCCSGCRRLLSRGEPIICLNCRANLPETHFHLQNENPIIRKLSSRIPLEQATACYYFHKSSIIQSIIHQFKYKNKKDTAFFMGKLMGEMLRAAPSFHTIDAIVPVPLHPAKKKKRGYNQSEILGEGMARILELPVVPHILRRSVQTQTQTHLNATDRWQNVKDAFILGAEQIPPMHVLLVDDVLTSGATLEACATVLREIPGIKISIATLAFAEDR